MAHGTSPTDPATAQGIGSSAARESAAQPGNQQRSQGISSAGQQRRPAEYRPHIADFASC